MLAFSIDSSCQGCQGQGVFPIVRGERWPPKALAQLGLARGMQVNKEQVRPRQGPGALLPEADGIDAGRWATPGPSLQHWAHRTPELSCVTRGRGSPALGEVLRDGSRCCMEAGLEGMRAET